MNGLRDYRRDTTLPARAGDRDLCPPDVELFAGLVNVVPGLLSARAVDARYEHARWKPHVSCAVLAAVRCDDGVERLVTWKRYATDKARHVAADTQADVARGAPAGASVVVLPHEHVVLTAFPGDRVLDGLERAFDLQRSCRLLAASPRFEGLQLRHRRSAARLVRYKPERRAVVRLDLVARDAANELRTVPVGLRALPIEDAARAARARRESGVAVCGLAPELLVHEERTGYLFETWLDVASCAHDDFTTSREVGAKLARLHARPVPAGTPSRRVESLEIESTLFELDRAAWASVGAWRGLARPVESATAWIHGDVHPDQVARERVRGEALLLDWDALRLGGSVVDLASWIADAEAADTGSTEAATRAAREELLAGYADEGGIVPDERDLDRAVAAALMSRAASAVRRLEEGAVDTARRWIELARAREAKGSSR